VMYYFDQSRVAKCPNSEQSGKAVWNDCRTLTVTPPSPFTPHKLEVASVTALQCICTHYQSRCKFFWGYRPMMVQPICPRNDRRTRNSTFQRLFRSTNMRLGRVPFFSLVPSVKSGPGLPSVRSYLLPNQRAFGTCPSSRPRPGPTTELRLMRSNVTGLSFP
jgi:hypothetical protein